MVDLFLSVEVAVESAVVDLFLSVVSVSRLAQSGVDKELPFSICVSEEVLAAFLSELEPDSLSLCAAMFSNSCADCSADGETLDREGMMLGSKS